MPTFGTIASAQPNVLFDPMAVDHAVQGRQRNQLLMEQNQLRAQEHQADRRIATFERDREHVARASSAILGMPEADRPAAYLASVQELQRQGIAMQAPGEYPGHQQIQMLARAGLTVPQQQAASEREQGRNALAGLFGGAPAAASPNVAAPMPVGQEPRGIRNNNPLNLSFAGQPGATMEQHPTPRFARFETPEHGIAASVNQLRLYQRRGNNTLAGMINTWAPPSENDTRGYVRRVAAETGLDPSQPVNLDDPAVAARLVQAMARMETGRPLDAGVAQRGVAARTGGADMAGPGVPAAPASPAASSGTEGLTPTNLTTIRAMIAAGTPPASVMAQVETMRQHNDAARRADDAGRRADETARRAEDLAARRLRLEERAAGGAYQGTSIEAQDSNILLRGDDGSRAYAAAYARQAAPRVNVDGSTVPPNMAAYDTPTFRGGTAPEQQGPPDPSAPTQLPPDYARQATTEPTRPTADQSRVGTYAARMTEANRIFERPEIIEALGSTAQRTMGGMPVVGNYIVSSAFQQADQAQRNFINSTLRRESGAVISESEFANARRQYLPQPGDDADTLAQKAANRRTTLDGFIREGGPAYREPAAVPETGQQRDNRSMTQRARERNGGPVSVTTQAQAEALAPGTVYTTPDGRRFTR